MRRKQSGDRFIGIVAGFYETRSNRQSIEDDGTGIKIKLLMTTDELNIKLNIKLKFQPVTVSLILLAFL